MSVGTILLIIVVLILVGGIPQWGPYQAPSHFYGGGPFLGGGLGLIFLIVLLLVLFGRL